MLSWLPLLGGVAWADCPEPYPLDAVADDLGSVESALRDGDADMAVSTARHLREGLSCLTGVLPRAVVGRAYRAVGAALLTEEPDEASGWLRTAAVVDGGFRYTLEEIPREDHPIFAAWDGAVLAVADVEDGTVDGLVWSSGTFVVDGRRVSWPSAEPGMPHIVQRTLEGDVSTWRVEGNAFPPELVIAGGGQAVEGPSDAPVGIAKNTSRPMVEVSKVKTHNWPTERIVLVTGGSAALVGGGVLYGLAWGQRNQFEQSSTRADSERLARNTNTLTVSSTAAMAAGAGTLGFGILFFIVDGDPRPTLDFRF